MNKDGYAGNHKQVKVSVKTDTAMAFKKACESQGISMAFAISQFMERFCGAAASKPGYSPDLSTRRQRRAAVASIISQLERVRDNEERYLENIPVNLQGGTAFDNAEQCISSLEEALDLLASAYLYHKCRLEALRFLLRGTMDVDLKFCVVCFLVPWMST